MRKKDHVPIVSQATSNATVFHQTISNVSDAANAKEGSSGNVLMSKNAMNSLGSNSGSKKAIQSGGFQNFPGTVHLKSNKSRITGLSNCQSGALTHLKSATFSMMVLILDETTALFQS